VRLPAALATRSGADLPALPRRATVATAPSVERAPDGGAPLPRRQRVVPVAGGPSGPAVAASRRSPDEVRSVLSSYRSGLARGRSADGAPPAASDPYPAPEEGA
jgi:hypothetical protein